MLVTISKTTTKGKEKTTGWENHSLEWGQPVADLIGLYDPFNGDKTDAPGIIFGQLRDGGQRNSENVLNRCAVALDADKYGEDFITDLEDKLPGVSLIWHTTASHDPAKGEHRYRAYIPLSAPVNNTGYRRIAAALINHIGGELDQASTKPAQYMFAPTLNPEDVIGFYEADVVDGDPLDVGEWLTKAPVTHEYDGHEIDALHRANGEGEFNSAYAGDPEALFTDCGLPYDPAPGANRYSYRGSSSIDGLVYHADNDTYTAYQASDPANGLGTVTAFELVWAHRYHAAHGFRPESKDGAPFDEIGRELLNPVAGDFEAVDDEPEQATGGLFYTGDEIDNLESSMSETELFEAADGLNLLYRGMSHSFNGESGSGKSMLVQSLAVQELKRGRKVIYLDYESTQVEVLKRLKALGVERDDLAGRYGYVDSLQLSKSGDKYISNTLNAICAASVDVVVIDGVNAALNLHGWSQDSNDDVNAFFNTLVVPLERSGAAVVLIDHVTKSKDSRGNYAIGAQSKRSRLSGISYNVAQTQGFGIGRPGEITVSLGDKDRNGYVKGQVLDAEKEDSRPVVARFDVYPNNDGTEITLSPRAPLGAAERRRESARLNLYDRKREALNALADGQELSARELRQAMAGKTNYRNKAVDELVESGHIEAVKDGRKTIYKATGRPLVEEFSPVDEPL